MAASTASYDSALRPGSLGLIREGFQEAWSRRRLIGYLIRADLKKKGSDTLLGNLWWVIDPLLQMAIYVVLVTVIFDRAIEAYPLFVFSAILPWKWFSSSVGDGVTSVAGQERLIKQIQFPKIILPVASVMAGIVNFGFGLIPLLGLLLLAYPHHFSAFIVLIPFVAVVQLVFTLAVTIALAAVNVFFRDVGNVVRHFLRLWFYLSPGLYSAQQVEAISAKQPVVGTILSLNPFTSILESYRNVVYSGSPPLWGHLVTLLGVSLVLLALSVLVFKRVEPSFAKVL